jgi:hypothetical protein
MGMRWEEYVARLGRFEIHTSVLPKFLERRLDVDVRAVLKCL